MHRVDVTARAALIRMLGIFLRAENAILNDVESGVEERPGVRPRAQIAADSESALRENVPAQSEVGRTTERLIVPFGKTKSFLAGAAERRCQKTRSSILVLQRHRRIRQVNDRHTLHPQSRRAEPRAIAGLDGCLARSETPLWFLLVAGSNLHVRQHNGLKIDSLHPIRDEI